MASSVGGPKSSGAAAAMDPAIAFLDTVKKIWEDEPFVSEEDFKGKLKEFFENNRGIMLRGDSLDAFLEIRLGDRNNSGHFQAFQPENPNRFVQAAIFTDLLRLYNRETEFSWMCQIGCLIHLGRFDKAHIHFNRTPSFTRRAELIEEDKEINRLMDLRRRFPDFLPIELQHVLKLHNKGNHKAAYEFLEKKTYLLKEADKYANAKHIIPFFHSSTSELVNANPYNIVLANIQYVSLLISCKYFIEAKRLLQADPNLLEEAKKLRKINEMVEQVRREQNATISNLTGRLTILQERAKKLEVAPWEVLREIKQDIDKLNGEVAKLDSVNSIGPYVKTILTFSGIS